MKKWVINYNNNKRIEMKPKDQVSCRKGIYQISDMFTYRNEKVIWGLRNNWISISVWSLWNKVNEHNRTHIQSQHNEASHDCIQL